jgi:hypothetical protein
MVATRAGAGFPGGWDLTRAEYDLQISRIAKTEAQIQKDQAELRALAAEQDANAQTLSKAESVLEEW